MRSRSNPDGDLKIVVYSWRLTNVNTHSELTPKHKKSLRHPNDNVGWHSMLQAHNWSQLITIALMVTIIGKHCGHERIVQQFCLRLGAVRVFWIGRPAHNILTNFILLKFLPWSVWWSNGIPKLENNNTERGIFAICNWNCCFNLQQETEHVNRQG